ncbi:MAG: peptidase [Mucilaginibacter sp.]|nr:peptidase [Mucilaginibacter sp.]
MIKFYKQLFIVSLVLVAQLGFSQVKLSPEVKQAMDKVSADQIKADITYLADDKLKGRAPGTEGYQMAVDYVVSRLKNLDVKPAGENNTWIQTVKFRRAFSNDAVMTIDSSTMELKPGTDYSFSPNPVKAKVNVSAPLVFAGYGASEPKLGYDDYAGLDVKGKIVVIISGSPGIFSSSVAAHTRNAAAILKAASDHGAIGVIVGATDSVQRRGSGGSRGVYSIVDDKGNVVVSRTYYGNINVYGTIGYGLFNSLLQKAGKDLQALLPQLKAGKPQSFPLNTSVKVSYTSTYQNVISYNVIGKVAGTDPKLKNEYVVHSAHLDHLGIGRPVEGDSIYNGAHDNASGVASVLAIANIYKNIKVKPKRSILFVLMTGEELGDMGSSYFAKHPTVPVHSMVADVNTDMPTIIAPLLSVTALGAEHSSLAKQVEEAAGYLGLGVEDDPEPVQARFTRSDQYSFVVNGIPALHIKYGSKTADGKNNMNELVAPWRAKYYHKPQDDINGIFDFNAGKTYSELNFLIGYLVAQDPARPTWNVGDIFAEN